MGFVTDALGLTDFEGQEKAQKNAAKQADRSYALTKEQLDFQKEQYADWKAIYGDVQENLGAYYKELTPDRITSLGLENQQREYQNSVREMQKIFAQRGITPDSGINASTTASMNFANARERARIRTEAPNAAAAEKLKFLGVGLGQGTAMLGMIGNAYQSGAGNAANLSGANLNAATNLSNSNTGTMNNLWGFGTGQFIG